MAKFVRARKGVGILLHPETGGFVVPNPDTPVESTDPLVKRFPWAFVSDEDLAAELAQAAESARPAPVEEATAAPGEKRTTRRNADK